MDWRREIRSAFARHHRRPDDRIDDDVVEELAQHAEAAVQAARAEGQSRDAAIAHVTTLIDAWCADTDGGARRHRAPMLASAPSSRSWFAGVGLDVQHALRLFRRHTGFVVVSILMIALGIGATATAFSVVNGVLLKPLPWPEAGRIIRLSETRRGGTVNSTPVLTNATYLAWFDRAQTIDAIAGYAERTATLQSPGGAERVPDAEVTASLFPLLGVAPLIGPGFTAADEESPLVVLSYGFWQERFGGAADVIGRTLQFSTGPRTVVGVMPEGFMFPTPAARFWLPMHVPPPTKLGEAATTVSLFSGIARLKPGATVNAAADEAQAAALALPNLGPVIPAVFGSTGEAVVTAQPLADALVGDMRAVLWLVLAAVTLLWLAAVGNVASLQMAHAVARRREVAIRAAIGAGTLRLVRQLFVENALIGIAGGAAGVWLTAALLRLLPAYLPSDFPRVETLVIDARVLTLALVMALLATTLIALLPARLAARLDLRSAVNEDASSSSGWRTGPARSRQFIIAGQVAIAAMLLVGGTLLGRSFLNQWRLDRGFDGANVLAARIQLPPTRSTPEERRAAYAHVLDQMRRHAGVIAIGFSEGIPLGGSERLFASMNTDDAGNSTTISAILRQVTPGYLEAIGMRLSEGRTLAESDTLNAEPVAVVNRTFARRYLGDRPIDTRLAAAVDSNRQDLTSWRIVGIVDDVLRGNSTETIQPEIFVSTAQLSGGPSASSFITIRTAGDPVALVGDLRQAVRDTDINATIEQPMTMAARLMRTLARPRLYAVLFAGFSVFAALVAMAGIFGGLSYGVTQRAKEMALRMALGASRWDISRLVIGQGLAVTTAGLIVGLAAAALSGRVLKGFLFGVTPIDGWSYLAVAAAVLVVAVAACALPARRAASIDPLKSR